MAGKIATRNAYGEALVALAEKYPQLVVLDADLSSATMTKFFAAAYPDRFFDCGIAEANMTDIAAGMSTVGLKPFTNTFAVFAAGRAFEQVRNSIAYPGLNVTVVGSHGGVSVGEDGATHQAIEDFALMRSIPGMLVCCPCDGNEMRQAVEALINYEGPAYLRLGRPATEIVTDEIEGYKFELGKGVTLRDGKDVTIIGTPSSLSMRSWCSKPPKRPDASSPPRSTPLSAASAALCVSSSAAPAPSPWCATASMTSSAAAAPMPTCLPTSASRPRALPTGHARPLP